MSSPGSKAQLIVRNLEEEVIRELRVRAARHGRSAEAEHRAILREVLLQDGTKRTLKDLLLAIPQVGEAEDFAREDDFGRDIDL